MFWLGVAVGWLITTIGWLILLVVVAAGRRTPQPHQPHPDQDDLSWLEDEHDWPAT